MLKTVLLIHALYNLQIVMGAHKNMSAQWRRGSVLVSESGGPGSIPATCCCVWEIGAPIK